jgi:NAD+ kinase
VSAPQSVIVFSHDRTEVTRPALETILELAGEAGVEVQLTSEEMKKFGRPRGVTEVSWGGASARPQADLAIVLGGDGTILTRLRALADSEIPVFAVNYGAIGFLATVEPDDLDEGIRRALAGEFDVMSLPALVALTPDGERLGVNDVSFHRRHNGRVAELAYAVEGEQLGAVRCDGLVVSTPAGSTGYNLANGGPVLAWGVEGYIVSFIAPHTLTARTLVVAPGDTLEVVNRSDVDEVDVTADGQDISTLGPGQPMRLRFEHGRVRLAQAPGATFYHRLRDKFGRLSF